MQPPTDFAILRKNALYLFLAFLALTALVAITVMLGGEGDILLQVLLTTATLSAVSVCVMADATYVEHGGKVRLGQVGGVLAVLGALGLLSWIWTRSQSELLVKSALVLSSTAGFWSHALLLRIARLPRGHRWVTNASTLLLALLSLCLDVVIVFEYDANLFVRGMGILAILAGLASLAIPILVKLRGPLPPPTRRAELHLTHLEGDRYRDGGGRAYTVRPETGA